MTVRTSDAVASEGTATARTAWPSRLYAIPLPEEVRRDPLIVRAAYRLFELVVTLLLLVAALPIMLIEALIIRLDSPGPALFRHRRVGRSAVARGADLADRDDLIPPEGGYQPDQLYLVPQTITFLKFRTMYADAPSRFPDLYVQEYESHDAFLQGFYKRDNDPRVTKLGRRLRKMTLDELPNLFHVLSGSVRLVGPRPEGHLVRYYTREQMLKFAVTPGVTGLAQAGGRGELSIGDQLARDLEYVRTRSVWLDLRILWRTFVSVVTHRGAF